MKFRVFGATGSLTIVATLALVSSMALAQSAKGKPATEVEVTNFPATQAVEGTVSLANLPAVLTVMTVPPPRFQIVGFTSTALRGDTGVLGFTRACQQEFPASRMCTSEEVMDTVTLPVLPEETQAFVRPVWHGTGSRTFRDGDTGPLLVRLYPNDSSGVNPGSESLAEEATCHGWARSGGQHGGLVVDANGSFDVVGCVPRPVSCCALVP